jgi:transcriptional regulator with XRE-family HTH domain
MPLSEATAQSKRLGDQIRKAREAKGWSVRVLGTACEINAGTVSRLESGLIGTPSPEILQRLSEVLAIPLENLYAEAGYARTEGLPALPMYLRSKYKLTPEETAELEAHFRRLVSKRTKKGGRDGKRSS